MPLVPEETLEGKHARRQGKPRNPPHPEGSRDANDWLKGWDHEDRMIANRERRDGAVTHHQGDFS